jgi:hypothetical protein
MTTTQITPNSVQAMVSAAGNIVFTFPPPPQGTAFNGALSVPGAPPNAQFTVNLNGEPVGSFQGVNNFPLQVLPNQTLTITAPQLVSGTVYVCVFSGQAISPVEAAPPVMPSVMSTSSGVVEQQLLVGPIAGQSASVVQPLNISQNFRSLWIVIGTPPSSYGSNLPQYTGLQSGLSYDADPVPLGSTFGNMTIFRVQLYTGMDTTADITIPAILGIPYWIGADLAPTITAVYSQDPNGLIVQDGPGGVSIAGTVVVEGTSTPKTLPVGTLGVRSDGRSYPLGSNIAHSSSSSAGTLTLVSAPGAGLHIMLRSIFINGGASQGGAYTVTIGGLTLPLLDFSSGVGALNSMEFETGLLLDANTSVTWTQAAAFGEVGCTYDVVT